MADTMGLGDLQNWVAGNTTLTTNQAIALQRSVIPRVTTTQRDALTGVNVFAGLVVFNTTTGKLNMRNNANNAWEVVTSA